MRPLNNARLWARRAILALIAASLITVAGLGPLSGALGATATVSTDATTTPTNPGSAPGVQEAANQPPTTTSTVTAPPPPASAQAQPVTPPVEVPKVVVQRKQRTTAGGLPRQRPTTTRAIKPPSSPSKAGAQPDAGGRTASTAPNGVAPPPQLVAGQAGAAAAAFASSAASIQALGFYRIPLFLLPIYKAAAVQYGVPWQILAAINEIETDYGTDQSVSTAGAVGWMQFMPATWLQYGVDALDAGYADPYNPVDAVFAAARYLRAAGAASNLHAAILAYNHSEEYVSSVLLRAKLISSYPKSVIATLTGLTVGRLPVAGKRVTWASALSSSPAPRASRGHSSRRPGAPGSSVALPPAAAAAGATRGAAAPPLRLVDVMSAPNAAVVAVQDGRIVGLGRSRELGNYIVLRDVYGDSFTYAGLGSIARTYTLAKPRALAKSPLIEAASSRDPIPSLPASAGSQPPVTLSVRAPAHRTTAQAAAAAAAQSSAGGSEEEAPSADGKVRLFAHPGNPDAVAAGAIAASMNRRAVAGDRLLLRRGSVVASGTVLGHVRVPTGAIDGHLLFSIQPAGDSATIDPRPVLANWAQLQLALHPLGAKAQDALLGATASDVLLMSAGQLERAVLSDAGITLAACARDQIAADRVDRRLLAVLAFLSRSGLEPTVEAQRCEEPPGSPPRRVDTLAISAINGLAIAGHQGAGTISDLTIRTLLTLPAEFVPHAITSLMRYPGAPNTHAVAAYWNRISLALQPPAAPSAAHAAMAARTASTQSATPTYLSPSQWDQLMSTIAALPLPTVATKPSTSAIKDSAG